MDDLLLYGPPGTGKTHSGLEWLAERVEQDGAEVERAAFVSFTNAAVDEAKGRLSDRFGIDPAELPYCRTLHSLCKQSLGITGEWLADDRLVEFAEEFGYNLETTRKAAGDDDVETLRERAGSDAPLMAIWDFARHRLIPDAENGWQAFADYSPESVAFAPAGRFQAFVEDYERWKTTNYLRDYTDLLTEYLASPEPLNVSVAVVDECQDLSPLLWEVADRLFANAEYRATLGDDDQAIYSYSGAEPALMNGRKARHKVKLTQSYRLPRVVTETALGIIEQNEGREPKRIVPTAEEGTAERAAYLDDLPLLNGESWFVLARNWKILKHLLPSLEEAGIPYLYGGKRYSPWQDKGPLRAVRAILKLAAGQAITLTELEPLLARTSSQRGEKPGAWAYGSKRQVARRIVETPAARVTWRELLGLGMTSWGWERVMREDFTVLTREISAGDLVTYEMARKHGTLFHAPKVTLSSIHARKGQEADNVVCSLACTGGPARAMLRPWRMEEERRVAYVGVTRARKRFYGLMAQPTEGVFSWDLCGV